MPLWLRIGMTIGNPPKCIAAVIPLDLWKAGDNLLSSQAFQYSSSVGRADCFPESKTPYDILCRHAVFALLSNLRGYQTTQTA